MAAARGLTIDGHNCDGIVNLDPAWRFAATFLRDLPPGPSLDPGTGAANGLAFISQSGALAEEFIDKANARGLPLTSVVSVGNALHLGVEDYLAWLGERPEIGAALLFVESIEDHERFRAVARRVAAHKPVIAVVWRPQRDRRAGRCQAHRRHRQRRRHDRRVLRVVRHRAGREPAPAAGGGQGVRPLPAHGLGRRALILSNSGGPGVICADRASIEGLELGALPRAMADILRQQLPAEASVANPIDLLADAREDRFGLALETAMAHAPPATTMSS